MTITNINYLADLALVSQATYAYTTSDSGLKQHLMDDASFTATQDNDFAAHY